MLWGRRVNYEKKSIEMTIPSTYHFVHKLLSSEMLFSVSHICGRGFSQNLESESAVLRLCKRFPIRNFKYTCGLHHSLPNCE